MAQKEDNNYFSYLPENRLCLTLGCTMQSAGFTRVVRHEEYPKKTHPKDHFFDFNRGRILQAYQIVYISEGRGKAELGRGKRLQEINAGNVFILFPNVWHRYRPDRAKGWTEHWIECRGSAFELAQRSGMLDPNRPIYRNANLSVFNETFAEIHGLARGEAIENQPILSMLGMKLLAVLAAHRDVGNDGSARLVNTVRMMLLDRCATNQPMEQIAEELNVSYSHLRRRFRIETGMSMKEFQLSVRIQKAKDLLDNSEFSVKEIAARLGFSSSFHFSSQFRKDVGCPPSEWRGRL